MSQEATARKTGTQMGTGNKRSGSSEARARKWGTATAGIAHETGPQASTVSDPKYSDGATAMNMSMSNLVRVRDRDRQGGRRDGEGTHA